MTVSEPSKVSMGLGVKPVILYQIRTAYLPGTVQCNLLTLSLMRICFLILFYAIDAMVKRRYNDFLWLYNSLVQQYPASIIPILPDKSLRPQYDEIFLETRRKKLEWFLNRISEHEELSKSTIFEVFLLANDAKLASEKSKQENGSSIYLKKKSSSPAMSAAFAWVGNQVSLLNPLELFDVRKYYNHYAHFFFYFFFFPFSSSFLFFFFFFLFLLFLLSSSFTLILCIQ